MINENLILLGIVLLWSLLVFIIGRNAWEYYQTKQWGKMMLALSLELIIVFFTGGFIVFFIYSLFCSLNIDAPCVL